ncbi:MAG TPA: thermonuclease family protein [Bacillota bacterium]|nr:thermonuclease family protein [Bacillota bacterium]
MDKKKALALSPILSVTILIIVGIALGLFLYQKTPLTQQMEPPGYQVIRVIDGDTLMVEPIGKVRYIGVNTPEIHHPTKGVEYYGKEAFAANRQLVEGKKIRLEYDVQQKDKYGRTLAYVYVGNVFINAQLLAEGFAQVMTIPPNVKHADYFLKLQREAQSAGKGLWGNKAKTASPATAITDFADESVYYWVNIKSQKFHRANCKWAGRIKPANLTKSKNRDQLLQDGYTPCGACRP